MRMASKNISPGALGDIKRDGLKEDQISYYVYMNILFYVDQIILQRTFATHGAIMDYLIGER